ncbi:MAG: 2TM domain-containing protein, partial [Alphaproteobacteria bacterium]|nr:2TM domain-containing protein [Alphaproteobacteria bacterium]
HKVKQLKGFYINLTVYTAVFFGCVIAWLAMGGGAFWPIWVLLGCGIAAFSEGLRLGMLPVLSDILPFLRDDWEEKQTKILLKSFEKDKKTPKEPSKTSKKEDIA